MGKPQSTGNLVNALAQDSSNNIGIGGAANASFKFQVTGTSNLTGKLTINTGGTDDQIQVVGTAPSYRLSNATTGATINGFIAMAGATNNYIQDAVSGDMCIGNQNNGKIIFGFGSGTAVPKLSIDASGNATFSGALTGTSADFSGNNHSLASNNTLRFTDTDTATEANQQIGKIEFYSSDTSTPGAGVKAYIGAFAQDTTPDAYLSFATQDGSATPNPVERLRISSEGLATFSSSVTATDQIKVSGSGAYLSIYDTQASSKNWAIRAGHDAVGDLAIRQSNSTGGDPVSAGTNRLYFSSTGAATFSSSVTTSLGQFIAQPSTTTSGAYSGYLNDGGQLYVGIDNSAGSIFSKGAYAYNIYGNANRAMVFSTDGTARLTIAGTGAATFSSSVTTGNTLYVNGDSNSIYQKALTAGSALYWDMRNSADARRAYIGFGGTADSNFVFNLNENGAMDFATNNTFRMRITSGGNVGIGTSNPSYLLHVNSLTTGYAGYFGYSQTAIASNGLILLQSGRIPQSGGDQTGEAGVVFNHSYGTGGVNGNANGGYIKSIRTSVFGTTSGVNTDLIFATTSANTDNERMRISSNGVATFTSTTTNLDNITIKNGSNKTNVIIGSAGGTALFGGMQMFNDASNVAVYLITDSTANSYMFSGLSIGANLSSYKLQISTDSAGKPNGGSWANSSDIRLKENIHTIENALDKITQLRGVTFDWKDETEQDNIKSSAGFIADEVMLAFPNWVKEVNSSDKQKEIVNDDKIKSLSLPFEFDALLVQAIKEQQAQIEELTQKVNALENK